MAQGYKGSVESEVLGSEDFRRVLFTGEKMQLVAMTLQPGEEIGEEDHDGHDQFFRIEKGVGEVKIGETVYQVQSGDLIVIPSGALHNVTNTSETELMHTYTIYAPPEHPDGVRFATKAEAEAAEADH